MLQAFVDTDVTDRSPVGPVSERGWSAVAARTLGFAVSSPVRRVIPGGVPNDAVPLCEKSATSAVLASETVTPGADRILDAGVDRPELTTTGCVVFAP
jgi:hypothetical protein